MTIRRLQDHIINQIAAGEVVERPASVVKELVENSIDAQASQIVINVEDGGKRLIEIIDNGLGIAKEDFALLFERHATSKIAELEDLQAIVSMGFRGEALASIGSVAEVQVRSRAVDSDVAYAITHCGPTSSELMPSSRAQGTTIRVKDIFVNVPAREKYLKGANTEFRYITKVVADLAAANPEVDFVLTHDGKEKAHYPKTDLLNRALSLLGLRDQADLFPIHYQSQDFVVVGYVTQPQHAQKRRSKQYVVVNQRALSVPFIERAIKDALHTIIPHDYHPRFLLQVTINPQAVDMNVHPRKLEARFAYQQFVFQKLKAAVAAAAEKHLLTAKLSFGELDKKPTEDSGLLPQRYVGSGGPRNYANLRAFNEPRHVTVNEARTNLYNQAATLEPASEREHQGILAELPEATLKPLGQIAESYIVAAGEEGIVIIDQHAAHERIRYAKLMTERQKYAKAHTVGQQLLNPLELELTTEEAIALTPYLAALKSVGFDLGLDGQQLRVKSIPVIMRKEAIDDVVRGIVADVLADQDELVQLNDMEDRILRVINYAACRSAIKFGQALTTGEQQALLVELEKAEGNFTCPHGRPTRVELRFKDLEKQFGR